MQLSLNCINVKGAMNACRCGYYPDRKRCRCTLSELRQYMQKLSRPLLDRIDISVEVKPLSFFEAADDIKEETSEVIRERVMKVHRIQRERFLNESFCFNSKIPHTLHSKYCPLSPGDKSYMEETFEKLSLSARAYHRILRVARTIAAWIFTPRASKAFQKRRGFRCFC